VCVFITAVPIIKLFARGEGDSGGHVLRDGTREEPGTLTQGGALFSLVPLVWESNPKLQGGWCKPNHQPMGGCKRQDREVTKRGVCFITAGPITKLCAWGEEESGGHVL
jgi:hypothetical protein